MVILLTLSPIWENIFQETSKTIFIEKYVFCTCKKTFYLTYIIPYTQITWSGQGTPWYKKIFRNFSQVNFSDYPSLMKQIIRENLTWKNSKNIPELTECQCQFFKQSVRYLGHEIKVYKTKLMLLRKSILATDASSYGLSVVVSHIIQKGRSPMVPAHLQRVRSTTSKSTRKRPLFSETSKSIFIIVMVDISYYWSTTMLSNVSNTYAPQFIT
jgi:hypothetical protein